MQEPISDICIVLGVYNGSEYLKEQIHSLIAQHGLSWKILSRDDGSHDNSLNILKKYSNQDPRISLIQYNKENLGIVKNFEFLMSVASKSSCKYIACSDQDDVWNSNKLTEQLALMKKTEEKYPGKAVLIHSDLAVVDSKLNSINASFMQYRGIHPEHTDPLKVLLVSNFVTGCTVLINRRLLEIALPIPKEAIMHDWWLAICAAVFGHIEYINKPLVKYRQHENNRIGAKSISVIINPFKTNWYRHWLKGFGGFLQTMAQAGALSERVKKHDPLNHHLPILKNYASLHELSPLKRVKTLNRLGIHSQGFIRHLFLLSRLILRMDE